jgi:aryl-alcohol dehydrogenase-like predicted oxidoreductase
MVPRFQSQNLEVNLALVDALAKVAEGIGATVAQVATAWVSSRGNDVVPLIGARHREQLAESLGAADLVLSDEDLAAIEEAIPAGDRYPAQQLAALDSER